MDNKSAAVTIPVVVDESPGAFMTHEARTGKLSSESLSYLLARGYSDEEAMRLLVGGFVNDIFKKLPLEYAIELNKLIDLEMKTTQV